MSVATVCPACTLNVVFNTKRRLYDPNRDTSSCSSECPACGAVAHFWVVDMVGHARADGDGDPGVYILPSPSEQMNMQEHADAIPESVLQYCKTAQDIYFSGNLMASNVLIKTAMETIFDDFLPLGNSRGNLSMMIRDSISAINHNEPLAQLVSSTGKQGDLHELFNKHHETDKETAEALMELLETLVTYLYVLPHRFQDIYKKISDIKNETDKREHDDNREEKRVAQHDDSEDDPYEDAA